MGEITAVICRSEEEYWDKVGHMSGQVSQNYLDQAREEPFDSTLGSIIGGMAEQCFPILTSILGVEGWSSAEVEFLMDIGELMFLSDAGSDDGFDCLMSIFEKLAMSACFCSAVFPSLLIWGMRWNALVLAVFEDLEDEEE